MKDQMIKEIQKHLGDKPNVQDFLREANMDDVIQLAKVLNMFAAEIGLSAEEWCIIQEAITEVTNE